MSSPAELKISHSTKGLWALLPPLEEVIKGCKVFMNCYFQLGFLPKFLILDRLQKEPESVNVFLLLSIPGLSARFTPSLVSRYGGHAKATRGFVERAEKVVPDEIYKPTLKSVQAFNSIGIHRVGERGSNSKSCKFLRSRYLADTKWHLDSLRGCCYDGRDAASSPRGDIFSTG
jgi:hypothetical protein